MGTMHQIDVGHERSITPGCANRVHFNHAGSSLPTQHTVDTQIAHLRREAEIGGYEAADEARDRIEAVYSSVAALVGCEATEIALVENATVGWQQAFSAMTAKMGKGDRLLTARAEYGANIVAYIQLERQRGVSIEVIPDDEHGATSAAALAEMMDDRVKLVAVTHLPTNGGLINPAAEIGQVCKAAGVRYLLDACQAAGQLDLDVNAIGCDALTVTGRKYLRGPRGTGFLYMSQELLDSGVESSIMDHLAADLVSSTSYVARPDARRFENWENNYASILGFGVAVDHAIDLGVPNIENLILNQASQLRRELSSISGVEVTDIGSNRSGICTFVVDGVASSRVKALLGAHNVNVSTSSPASTIYDSTARALPTVVRASVHYLTTASEIAKLCELVSEAATSG